MECSEAVLAGLWYFGWREELAWRERHGEGRNRGVGAE